jgi:hypothetical protein
MSPFASTLPVDAEVVVVVAIVVGMKVWWSWYVYLSMQYLRKDRGSRGEIGVDMDDSSGEG